MGAPPFVPLPSGNNPSVGAAAGAAQSASSAYLAGLQFATALRNFNAQQQQQAYQNQQQGLKAQMDRHLQMVKAGYTQADTVTHGTPSTPSTPGTLSRRDAKPGVDPSQVVTDEFGRRWVSPPAKPDATPQQTYTDLQGALEKGGQPVSPQGNVHQMTTTPRVSVDMQGNQTDTGKTGVNVPVPDPSRVVTPPGSKQGIYMPTVEEKASLLDQLKAASGEAGDVFHTQDTDGTVNVFRVDKKTGKVEKTGSFEGAAKAAPDPTQSIIPGFLGPKGGPITRDPKTGKTTELEMPPGAKRSLTEGQEGIQERFRVREEDKAEAERNRNDAVIEKLQAQSDKLKTESDQHYALSAEYAQRINKPDGTLVSDPMDKTQTERPLDAKFRERLIFGYKKAKMRAFDTEKQGTRLTSEIEARRQRSQRAPAAPAAKPAQAAAPTSQAKPAQPAAPQFKVGDPVMHNGKPAKVVGFNPDGTVKISYQ